MWPAIERPKKPGAGLMAAAVLMPFGMALWIGVLGWRTNEADKRSIPYLYAPAYEDVGGCGAALARNDRLPAPCVDGRYRIRRGYGRFRLPQPGKGQIWLRVGEDAVKISATCRRDCVVWQVRRAVFSPQAVAARTR